MIDKQIPLQVISFHCLPLPEPDPVNSLPFHIIAFHTKFPECHRHVTARFPPTAGSLSMIQWRLLLRQIEESMDQEQLTHDGQRWIALWLMPASYRESFCNCDTGLWTRDPDLAP